jgi:hypothetical protein
MKPIFSSEISNFRKILPVETELFYGARETYRETERQAGSWTDRQTDMKKLLLTIHNFVKSPRKDNT